MTSPSTPESTVTRDVSTETAAKAATASHVQGTWQRWRGWQPLTMQGLVLIALGSLLVYFYGIKRGDWLLLAAGSLPVLLVVIDLCFVSLTALLFVRRVRRLNPAEASLSLRAETGRRTITSFQLARPWNPFVDVEVRWLEPSLSVEIVRSSPGWGEQIVFPRRGLFSGVLREFQVRDLFGLASIEWRQRQDADIQIVPQSQSLVRVDALSMAEGDGHFVPGYPRGGDRVDTRPYIPGDPVRFIHWKLFARTRIPIIRIRESAAVFDQQIVAYLICDTEDESVASLARHAIEAQELGEEWLFSADGCGGAASHPEAARQLLAQSGRSIDGHGRELTAFLDDIHYDAETHRLLLFASGQLDLWLPEVEPVLRRYLSTTTLVVYSPEGSLDFQEQPPTETKWWTRWFFSAPSSKAPTIHEMWGRLRAMGQEGLQLRISHQERTFPVSPAQTTKSKEPARYQKIRAARQAQGRTR